jgi:RNA polymerase sigma factor (sigma-70 family)
VVARRRNEGMKTGDERALLARAAGDVEAFEAIYRRYVGRVTAYATSRCTSAADVADVVAQTFVRLLRTADQYDPERGEPVTFLMVLASSAVGDHYRQVNRERRLVHRLAGRDLLDADESDRIDAAIDAARAAGPVQDALAALPVGEAEVIELVAAGASPAEAAAALDISAGAARVRLHRGRSRLRSKLSNRSKEA